LLDLQLWSGVLSVGRLASQAAVAGYAAFVFVVIATGAYLKLLPVRDVRTDEPERGKHGGGTIKERVCKPGSVRTACVPRRKRAWWPSI